MIKARLSSGLLCLLGLIAFAVEAAGVAQSSGEREIDFWNGNKTESRQAYEREVLNAVLKATAGTYDKWVLKEDLSSYPEAAEEASVFRAKGHDLFVTVAGNKKLENEEKIIIPVPLMKGLLGYRLLIIREQDRKEFSSIETTKQLQSMRMGIPRTWADADLFRYNGYKVVERGSFDDLFERLTAGEFDYVAFGANEIESVFESRAKHYPGLMIEPTLLIYYPFPLVFYVNPDEPALAERIRIGLDKIQRNGQLERIFDEHYAGVAGRLHLRQRHTVRLENPSLPSSLKAVEPKLLVGPAN